MNEIANHLWQSTVFTVVIALAAVAFRRNSPRLRYWLWLAATVKFLIPVSLIVSTGARIPIPHETLSPDAATVVQISAYFEPVSELPAAVPGRAGFPWILTLAAVWLIGVFLLVFRWFQRWRTIHRAVGRATRLPLLSSVPILSSAAMMEPGVFGLFRPVLLLPVGIAEKLTPKQFEAILAHELRHVRCFDNLTAAVHMGTETLFWFHPLVWWIGAKLMDERERDCDEAVLRQGSQPGDYARGIVQVCETYVKGELSCASGISGSDLKKRVREIMTWRGSLPVTLGGKVILTSAAIAAVSVPFAIGVLRAQTAPPALTRPADTPQWEVVSVKPCSTDSLPGPGAGRSGGSPVIGHGRMSLTCETAAHLIRWAYDMFADGKGPLGIVPPEDKQIPITGGPDWMNSQRYSVNAKAEGLPTPAVMQGPMLQVLLEEYFKLKIHREEKEGRVYDLTIAKGGLKIQPLPIKSCIRLQEWRDSRDPAGPLTPDPSVLICGGGGLRRARDGSWNLDLKISTMAQYADLFRFTELDSPVIDRTGVTGFFNFHMAYSPQEAQPSKEPPAGPSLFTALQEQLGLRLVKGTGPVPRFVVDHIEKPAVGEQRGQR